MNALYLMHMIQFSYKFYKIMLHLWLDKQLQMKYQFKLFNMQLGFFQQAPIRVNGTEFIKLFLQKL